MKKAQVSMEYFIVMGFIFLTSAVLMILFITQSSEFNDNINSQQAYQITQKVADAADKVYYLGENSKITIKVNIPNNIINSSIDKREIIMTVNTRHGASDMVSPTLPNVTGSLPTKPSIYYITILSKKDYVEVSYK